MLEALAIEGEEALVVHQPQLVLEGVEQSIADLLIDNDSFELKSNVSQLKIIGSHLKK